MRIAFDLDETLGLPRTDGGRVVGWHVRSGCLELLAELHAAATLCLWTVSSRRYVDRALSFGLGEWFEEVYSWDEMPVRWKDVRRIGVDFLVDDSPEHQDAARPFGLESAYIVVPPYGSPADAADPLQWARQVREGVR